MAPKLGVQEGYLRLLDAQLWSVFHQVKIFPNDPKLLGHSGIGPNFSKIIVPKIPENFRAAYCPCPSKLTNFFSLTCFSLVLEVGKAKIVLVRPHLVATDLRRDTREIPLSSPNVSSSASESELEAADTFPPALEANTRFLQMSTTAAAATKVSKGTKVWEPIFFICLSLCQYFEIKSNVLVGKSGFMM